MSNIYSFRSLQHKQGRTR